MQGYTSDLTTFGLRVPVWRELAQEHQDNGSNHPREVEFVLPSVEQEREGGSHPSSRQLSPMVSYSHSSLRSDRVSRLPVDQSSP